MATITIDIEEHLGLVGWVIQKFYYDFLESYPTISYDDLMQEGTIGLLIAKERFDPSLGWQFSTFAIWHVQNEIDTFIKCNSRPIQYSYDTSRQAKRAKDLTQKEEIMDLLLVNEARALEILHYQQNSYPTELVPDTYYGATGDNVTQRLHIQQVLQHLDPTSQAIIQYRLEGKTLREIGALLNLSHTTIADRLKKIRQRVANDS